MNKIDDTFLENLDSIVSIRESLMKYCDNIILKSDSNQSQEIDRLINEILEKYQIKYPNKPVDPVLESSIKILLEQQLKFSIKANKIRKGKGNPPPIFM